MSDQPEHCTYQPAPAHLEAHKDGYAWVVDTCPICGQSHVHGGGGLGDDPRQRLGHRVAHCAASEHGGYVLVEMAVG